MGGALLSSVRERRKARSAVQPPAVPLPAAEGDEALAEAAGAPGVLTSATPLHDAVAAEHPVTPWEPYEFPGLGVELPPLSVTEMLGQLSASVGPEAAQRAAATAARDHWVSTLPVPAETGEPADPG